MKLQYDLIDLSGNPRNGVFESQADADKWLQDHVSEFGENPEVTKTDLTAQDEKQKALLSRKEVREGCADVIDMISAANKAGGATDAQTDAFYTNPDMIAVILMLLAGDPAKAAKKIAVIGPTIYPQSFVDEVLAALQALE